MDFTTLARLVERAKQGDDEAFTDIYMAFSKSVYYLALRLIQNDEDAKDVVQETMLIFSQNLNTLENTQAVVAFVNKVAFHQCTRILRKRKPHEVYDEQEWQAIADEDEDFIPEKYADKKERREYLVNLVDGLSEPLRKVVMLHYYNEYTVSHIAKLLDIGESAVKMRLSRAREALKIKIEKEKDMVQSMVSVPVLTRVLQTHADEVFTTEISVGMWQNIAEKLGYSAEAIARTSAIVAGTAGGASAAASGTAAAGAAAAATKTAASSIVTYAIIGTICTAIIGGVTVAYQLLDGQLFGRQTVEVNHYVGFPSDEWFYRSEETIDAYDYDVARSDSLGLNETIFAEEISTAIASQPTETMITENDLPIQTMPPAVNQPQVVAGLQSSDTSASETPYASPTLPDLPGISGEMPTETPTIPTEHPTIPDEPTTQPEYPTILDEPTIRPEYPTIQTIPNPPSTPHMQTSTETPDATPNLPPSVWDVPQIMATTSQLQFSLGSTITEAQILQYAGITAIDQWGQPLDVSVVFLDEIDFNTPGRHAVYVRIVDDNGHVLIQKVIVIIIEA